MKDCLQCLSMFVRKDKQQNTDNHAENGVIGRNVCQFVALREYADWGTELTNRQTMFKNWPNGP